MTIAKPRENSLPSHWYGAEQRKTYQLVKRTTDLAICLLALPVLTIIMALIALAIILDSPGPALFIQERVGKDRRPFRMFKFRTMRHDYDMAADRAYMASFVAGMIDEQDHQPARQTFKPNHSAQITRVGRFLRRTSLDELPQLINVLRGEMSLIGPRPNVAWEVDAYAEHHLKRLAVLPGITGWAQVNGRSGIRFETIAAYDIEYVEHCCLKLDLQILWMTVQQVLLCRGAG